MAAPDLRSSVGFLGLGAMGRPMAQHLADDGFSVVGFDPYPPDPQTIPDVTLVDSLAHLTATTELIICTVATAAQADEALLGDDGTFAQLAGTGTVVVMSTLGPESVRRLDAAAQSAEVGLVDAPMSGGVARARTGELLIMTAARTRDADRAAPVLAALGDPVRSVGSVPGEGQAVKLVNQLLCGAHIVAAAEALALATRLGVDPRQAWETVRHGAAASFMLDDRGQRMLDRDFEEVRSAVDIFVKDMGLVTGAAEAAGLAVGVANSARDVFVEASGAGYGRKDDSSIIDLYLGSP